MSCYSQTKTGPAFAARRTFSLRAVFKRVIDRVRVARNRQRQHRELIEYLASDHRAANDLGITSADDPWRASSLPHRRGAKRIDRLGVVTDDRESPCRRV
jgi:hypothetical protein